MVVGNFNEVRVKIPLKKKTETYSGGGNFTLTSLTSLSPHLLLKV